MKKRWNRLKTFWWVETLEHVERHGYLEDNEVLGRFAQDVSLEDANDEELIVRRAIELSARHPRGIRLKTNIGHLITSARYLLTVCVLVAIVAGISAASAIFSASRSIDVVTASIRLVRVNLMSLMLTVILIMAAPRKIQFSLPGAWLWLSSASRSKVQRSPAVAIAGKARRTNWQDRRTCNEFKPYPRDRFTTGQYLVVSGSYFSVSIEFVWETTILLGLFCSLHRPHWYASIMVELFRPCPLAADIVNRKLLMRHARHGPGGSSEASLPMAWRCVWWRYPLPFWSSQQAIDNLSVNFTNPYYFTGETDPRSDLSERWNRRS